MVEISLWTPNVVEILSDKKPSDRRVENSDFILPQQAQTYTVSEP
jgi:hypothetical protein